MGAVLAVLGSILKWILLLILGLVGLVLLLVLILLLAKLRYRIEAEKGEGGPAGSARVSWLLGLIRFRLQYQDGKLFWEAKVGPKRLASSEAGEPKKQKPKKMKAAKPPKQKEASPPEPVVREEKPEPAKTVSPSKPEPVPERSTLHIPAAPAEEKKESEPEEPKKESKLKSTIEKMKGAKEKWDSFPRKGETVKAVLALVKGLLKPIFPRRCHIRLLIGLDDPATTGKILGYYYMLGPLLAPKKQHIELEGCFTEKVIEVEGWAKGHFCIGSFIPPLIKALLNGDIRYLIRYIRSKD